MLPFSYTIFPLGDSALTIDFGNHMNEAVNECVLQLFHRLQNTSPFIRDVIPAYASLTVYYDVLALRKKNASAFEAAKALLQPLLKTEDYKKQNERKHHRIPVCYAERFAPDLTELASVKNIPVGEVIALHTNKDYRIYMLGFLPGFAYMGKVDDRIAMPRKAQPRTTVPAGSVGIAGEQTGIYPLPSPGGWNLIGRTPVTLFDAGKEDSVLFQPGDAVSFYSISEDEFENYPKRHP